jgi:hypothetical protein
MKKLKNYIDFLNEKLIPTDFIYHGTSKGAALRIQNDGFMNTYNTGDEEPSISFSNDIDYAKYYAKVKGGSKDRMVILRIKLDDRFKISDKILKNKGAEYVAFQKIPSSELEILIPDGSWKPLDNWNVIFNEPLNEAFKHLRGPNEEELDSMLNNLSAIDIMTGIGNKIIDSKYVELAVSKGYLTNNDPNDILVSMINCNSLKYVKYAVENGADVNSNKIVSATPLLLAAHRNSLDIVKYLIENGADINFKSAFNNYTAIMYATESENLNMIEYLVEKGARINLNGLTPLMIAARKGKLQIVTYLVEHGANLKIKNNDGKTALSYAIIKKDFPVVKYLVDNYQRNIYGFSIDLDKEYKLAMNQFNYDTHIANYIHRKIYL